MTTPAQRLCDDTRGIVLVMGVVFAALLTGLLFHLVGVGDAIIYRERMQEAADATAFESAVWHARTMNLLVVLNIIMSGILMFLVAWRTAELLLLVGAALFTVLTLFFPPAEALALRALEGYEKMMEKDPKIFANVEKWLIRLNKVEKIVSTAAPAINLLEPAVNNTGYYAAGHSVDAVFPVSASIAPSVESFAQGAKFPPRMNMGNWLPAMPVQEDGYWKLCAKAGEFGFTQIAGVLGDGNVLGAIASHFGSVAYGVVGSFPGYFCGSIVGTSKISKVLGDAADEACVKEQGRQEEEQRRTGKGRHRRFDMEGCKKQTKVELQREKNQLSVKPAKVWDVARNGGVFLQAWSIANGDPEWSYSDDPGVVVASGGGRGAGAGLGDATNHHWQIGQAEYYYDPGNPEAWDICSGDAMWNIAWKARLRRVRDPVRMFDAAGFVTGYAVNALNKMMDETIKNWLKNGKNSPVKGDALEWLRTNAFDTWWSNKYIKGRGLRNAGQRITYGGEMQNWGIWAMDHLTGSDRSKLIH